MGVPVTNDATVTAADIARLAGVGRAAVSNWRRRHDDFPRPVGGTAVSPAFSLAEVEGWLLGQGKLTGSPVRERVWQTLRQTVAGDADLAGVLAFAGAFLLYLNGDPAGWRGLSSRPDKDVAVGLPGALRDAAALVPGLADAAALPRRLSGEQVAVVRTLAELADELGAAETFEFLRTRYLEHHSRRVYLTPEPVVRLMLDLGRSAHRPDDAGAEADATVFDPACGTGAFLTMAHETSGDGTGLLLGEEIDDTTARMTAIRLALLGARAEVCPGDSLRADAFTGRTADLVVSNPPFNDRSWGYEELTGDPRWEYGLPPRMESELAWLQHGLAHARPGGSVVMLMPPAVANRRSGRRIRSELLRRGTLRAVIGLPAGAVPNMAVALTVWILRRPAPGDHPADDVLMVDTSAEPDAFQDVALEAWRRYLRKPEAADDGTGRSVVVRIIDLLDDEVDLTPARYLPQGGATESVGAFTAEWERLEQKMAELPGVVSGLSALTEAQARDEAAMTTIGELAKGGVLEILRSGVKVKPEEGPDPALTLDDVIEGRGATGSAAPGPDDVRIAAGDVVVPMAARHPVARVVRDGGAVLGPGLALVRVDPARADPDFVAGWLRLGARDARLRSSTSTARFDVRRARLPRLTRGEQEELGAAFRRLADLEAGLRELQELGGTVVRLGLEGLGAGTLRPEG
ncbi:N-6 DNA methylase [Actinomadura sp. LCR2-06]|uniref:N-6 DNA methylase n=1 Tax=Actinomadura violacea TaxID=2819934 RepID=A0ABS3RKN2_9ACTN|nr:N-6 DNA methylase [Actinomadura violacea]